MNSIQALSPISNDVFVNKIVLPNMNPEDFVCLSRVNRIWYQLLLNNELWEGYKLLKEYRGISANTIMPDGWYLKLYLHHTGFPFAHNAQMGNLRITKKLIGHYSKVTCVMANDLYIFSASYDNRILLWDRSACFKDNKEVAVFSEDFDDVIETSFAGHEDVNQGIKNLGVIGEKHFVIAGTRDKNILIRKPSNEIIKLVGHQEWVTCLRVCGEFIVSGAENICIWNQNGVLLKTLQGHEQGINCLQFINNTIISGSDDKTIRIWDAITGSLQHTLLAHTHSVTCVDATKNVIVSGSYDNTIRIWNRLDHTLQHTLKGHTGRITCLRIIGHIIVSGSADKTVRIWNISTGQLLHTYPMDTTPSCIDFHIDTLFIGCSDGIIYIFSNQ